MLVLFKFTYNVIHLCRDADTESKDVNSCTPFLVAAANGSTEVVAKLEKIEDKPIQVDELDKDRKSAVYLAAEGAHLPLLKVDTVLINVNLLQCRCYSCYYWCWCSMLGDSIIPADSLSTSLGIGLSITLKAGVELLRWLWGAIAQWSEHL